MAQDSEHLETTVFMPHSGLGRVSDYVDCIPHYLFRTSSPQSSGTTTKTCIASAAVKYHLDRSDMLSRDREEAVEMLKSPLSSPRRGAFDIELDGSVRLG
jgi:hypothetical protein